jgi:hypothetical protein
MLVGARPREWRQKRAAAMLGVDARNLPYLLRKHHLDSASQPDGSFISARSNPSGGSLG